MKGNRASGERPLKAAGSMSLFALTWPLFLELTLFTLMGSADTFMLSGVSDAAVSGVGAANQFIFVTILLMEVVAHGAAIVVSQYLGSRKPAEASRIAGIAISLNVGAGVAISAGYLLFGGALLRAMNLQGDVLAHAQTYLAIVGGSLVLQAAINTMASLIRVHGYTRESMFVSLGMNVLNVIGNYVLIFGHFGAPELGVAGAAASTALSRAAAAAVFFWMLYRIMEVRIRPRDYVAFSKDYIGKIARVGIPSAVEQVTYHVCQTVFLYYVTYLGAAELAARQYAVNITQFIYLFAAAIAMGTAIIVGRLIGAGHADEAYGRVMRSLAWGLGFTAVVCCLVVALRTPIVELFTDDRGIVAIAAQVILCSLLIEPGRVFNLVLINGLRAAGDAQISVYMGFVSMVGVSLPLGYFLTFEAGLGLVGVFLAIAADEWLRGIVMLYRWRSRVWQGKALVASPASDAAST